MKKLSLLRASEEITKACTSVVESKFSLRFGQALWNNLDGGGEFDDLLEPLRGTSADFFYQTDPDCAVRLFYTHYVETEE